MKRIFFISTAVFCLLLISQNVHAFSLNVSDEKNIKVDTLKISPDVQKQINPDIGTIKLIIPETKEASPKTDKSVDSSSQIIRVEVKPSSNVSNATSSTDVVLVPNVKGNTISIGSSSAVGTGSATVKDTATSENKTIQVYVPPPAVEEKKQILPIVVEEKREIIQDVKSFAESKKDEAQSITEPYDTKGMMQNQSIEQKKTIKEIDSPMGTEGNNKAAIEEKFQFDDSGTENMQEKHLLPIKTKKNIPASRAQQKLQPQSKQIENIKVLSRVLPSQKIKNLVLQEKSIIKKNTKIIIPNKNIKSKVLPAKKK